MPSLRALKQAIIGPTIATQHDTLLATIETQRARRQEVPAIRRRIGDLREEIRAKESQLTKAGGALRGYEADPLRWSVKASEAREDMASLRRAIEDLTAKIDRDEQTISEITAFALPEVSPAVLGYHREQVEQAQTTVARIRDALDASKAELSALEATPGPAAELRRELSEALAGLALGTVTPEAVEAIEGQLSQAEAVTTSASAKARRVESTISGLTERLSLAQADLDRLVSATPIMQAECLAPEIAKAESAYTRSLAATVEAFDQYRALRHLHSAIRPDIAFPPLPDALHALKDAGQLRLAQAIEAEQERLASLGI